MAEDDSVFEEILPDVAQASKDAAAFPAGQDFTQSAAGDASRDRTLGCATLASSSYDRSVVLNSSLAVFIDEALACWAVAR